VSGFPFPRNANPFQSPFQSPFQNPFFDPFLNTIECSHNLLLSFHRKLMWVPGSQEREPTAGSGFLGTRNAKHHADSRSGFPFQGTRNPLWVPVPRNPEPVVSSRSKEPGTCCEFPFQGTRNPLWVPVPRNPNLTPLVGSVSYWYEIITDAYSFSCRLTLFFNFFPLAMTWRNGKVFKITPSSGKQIDKKKTSCEQLSSLLKKKRSFSKNSSFTHFVDSLFANFATNNFCTTHPLSVKFLP
jgi:hypothetical protein